MTALMEVTTPKTSKERVLAILQSAGEDGVTTSALLRRSGTPRYSARIYDLQKEGWIIKSFITPKNGNRRRSNGYTYILEGYDASKAARNKEAK